jgi:hypothetical protein
VRVLRWGGRLRGLLIPVVLVGVGVLSLPAGTGQAEAQSSVAVYPLAGLRFHQLSPGVPADIRPFAVGSRAEVDLVGTGRVTVSFQLPEALVSNGGHRIPLTFGASDGIWTLKGQNRETFFDPRLPLELNIPPSREGASIFLGGLATPGALQSAGDYTATVTVQTFAPGT